jgi:hypothetical protein
MCLIDFSSQDGLLKSILHYEILGYFPEKIFEMSLLLNIVFKIDEIVLVERRGHVNLIKQEIQLISVGCTN